MEVLHYVYLVLMMLGPNVVLSLRGDLRKSYNCNQEAIEYASISWVPNSMIEVLIASKKLSQSEIEILKKNSSQSKVKTTGDVAVKTFEIEEGNSSKAALIGTWLDPK